MALVRKLPFATSLVLAFAGCLGAAVPPEAQDLLAQDAAADVDLFGVEMKGCREGGGVSLYNMDDGDPGPVEPFRLANVQDDVGNPMVASYGEPIPPGGATWGIWHISLVCDSYSYQGEERGELAWGWVGVKIHPPAWDTSGIERQFFVADLSFPDPDILGELQDHAVHASETWNAKVEWLAPDVLHTVLDDEVHGVFETHSKMKEYRAFEPEPVRFWMLVSADGSHEHGDLSTAIAEGYRAISFDLATSGGDSHMVADITGVLSHTRTDAHGAVPGAAGNLAAVLYTGFDRTLSMGESPEMVFTKTWTH